MNIRLNLAVVAAALVCAVQAVTSFTYQGRLRDAQGNKITQKSQTVTFCLYDGPEVTKALWGRSVSVLLDDDGLFNVELSDSNGSVVSGTTYTTLVGALQKTSGSMLYIGVKVGSAGEIRPRQRILEVPFASIAKDVSSASGNFTAEGLVTAKGVTVNGTSTLQGKVICKGTRSTDIALDVSGGTTKLGNKLTISTGGMDVSGAAKFGSAVTMDSSLMVGSLTIGNANKSNPVSIAKKGMIMLWYGTKADVPTGWKICDGQNGTPNLQGLFVAGANKDSGQGGDYAVGTSGGANKVTLTAKQMPKHTHTYYSDDSVHVKATAIEYQKHGFDFSSDGKTKGSTYATSETGGGEEHENRPAYMALYYIMYTGN